MEKENIIWTVPGVAKYLDCNVSSIRKIEIVSSGKFNHRPDEYKFCDKWQKCNRNNSK